MKKIILIIVSLLFVLVGSGFHLIGSGISTGAAPGPVSATGSNVIIEDNTFTAGSGAVTIPADADICIVIVGAYDYYLQDVHIFSNGRLNWNGDAADVDFTHIVTAEGGATYDVISAYYMTSSDPNWPGSGSRTLYYDSDGDVGQSPDNGFNIIVRFYKDVDTSSPIVDSGANENIGGGNNTTGSLTGVGVNDLSIGAVYADGTSALDGAPTGYGQTEAEENSYNNANLCIGEELGESAIRLESAGYDIYGAIFFALASVL